MPSSIEISSAGVATDARRARGAVIQLLGVQRSAEFIRDAVLLTSELVTNAMIHTNRGWTLRASLSALVLRVEVSDFSERMPSHIAPTTRSITGRGLQLVDQVSTRWGTRMHPGGKTVWFEMHDSGAGLTG